ncbi:cyclin-O [Lates calcarifer]|uniref:G2/mitotic-specific cyclin-B2 n=1 Tax=Lates calcarifer TaxID=8187 RepID=A0AAJ7PJZ2_LATCA|nr:cyclin-O [Lates calcarifer]
MVLSVNGGSGSETVYKRRRMNGASPLTEMLTPAQQRQTARHRKQKLMSKLSDSGFEEDLGSSPVSSPVRTNVSPLRLDGPEPPPAEQLSSWYLQYGDIGYNIQREREAQFYPCKSLARQPQLNAEARCKLVSWLIPVHKHFRLSFECCCLAVNVMDRFLASTAVAADCFQLLGVTALLLASKQVEICSPRISHLLSLCCDAFTKEQLCNLECLILLRLNFHLAAPTLAFFLDYYTNCSEAAELVSENRCGDRFAKLTPDTKRLRQCSNLARKVCELSLADYAFNKYPPSLTASCALRLASELLKTEQGRVESATIQLQGDQWDSFGDELCAQPCESPEVSEGHSLIVKDHVLPVGQESYNHNLAQECKDNLKLLVSLNQETLEAMSTM